MLVKVPKAPSDNFLFEFYFELKTFYIALQLGDMVVVVVLVKLTPKKG